MVFIVDPRQAEKTTFAKGLIKTSGGSIEKWYMNWDAAEDRERIIQESGDKEIALATPGPGGISAEIAFLNRAGGQRDSLMFFV